MKSNAGEKQVVTFTIVLICFFVWILVRSAWSIKVDAAEFENLQASWLVSQGYVPYSQFFDHHTPLFFYLLTPFFPLFGSIQTDPQAAIQSISVIRAGMVFLTILIAGCVYEIVWLWRGKRTAWISLLLYLSIDMVTRKAIEIRPNLPATLFLMAAFLLLILSHKIERQSSLTLFSSGLIFSMAVLIAEETLLFGIWLLLILVMDVIFSAVDQRQKQFTESILVVAGFATGLIAFLVYLAINQTTQQFFLLLLQPDTFRVSPIKKILQLAVQNPLHFAFVGFSLVAHWRSIRALKQNRTERAVAIFAAGMLVSLLITMEPHGQYFFFVLPAYAILAGDGAVRCVSSLKSWLSRISHPMRLRFIVCLQFVVLVLLFWQFFMAGFPQDEITAVLVGGGVLCLMVGLYQIAQSRVSAIHWVVVASLFIGSARTQERVIHNQLANQSSIQAIQYIIANSTATDSVLDGRSGTGLYRPIAWYFWVQHTQIGEEISMAEVNSLVGALQEGNLRPKFVCLDQFLHRYPLLVAYVEQNYQPVGVGDLWQIKAR